MLEIIKNDRLNSQDIRNKNFSETKDNEEISDLPYNDLINISSSEFSLVNMKFYQQQLSLTELEFDIETPKMPIKGTTKRLRSMSMEETNQKETKSVKLGKSGEKREFKTEPMKTNDNTQNQNWRNIHPNFTSE